MPRIHDMRTRNDKQLQGDDSADAPRSFRDAVHSLDEIAKRSVNLVGKPLPEFETNGRSFYITRYLFLGPKGGAEPIRVGLFAGTHGNEPEGTIALREFVERLELTPIIAKDYCLFLYPLLIPSGYEANTRDTLSGVHIPGQIWKNTYCPEVLHLQSELWMHAFDGVISIKSDSAGSELGIAVGGPIFARHLLGAALLSAQDLLPQVVDSRPEALPKFRAQQLKAPNDLIRAAPGLKPRPFEIVITIPCRAPIYLQKAAVSLVLQTVLSEYRNFISYGANI